MNWFLLSLRNWQRRPLRMAVTTAGVTIAIASLASLLAFQRGYRDGMAHELDRLGAHVLVVPKGCPYDAASIALHGGNWPCYLKSDYADQVRGVGGVATVAPVFMSALYGDKGEEVVYSGIDDSIVKLKPGWKIEGRLPQEKNEVLAGAEAARKRQWHLDQTVALPELNGATGRVAGILQATHGAEDEFLYLRLSDAQRLFKHQGELTHLLVRLDDPDQMEDVVSQLRSCNAGLSMNVVPMTHLFRTIQALVNSTRILLGCIAFIALLGAGVGVGNAIMMAVVERTREIGVMRSLGASHGDIFRLFWFETLQVCLLGSTLGLALSFFAARAIEGWLRARLPFAPADTLIRPEGWITGACLAAALVLGSIAGAFPAWRASRLPPTVAMRTSGGQA